MISQRNSRAAIDRRNPRVIQILKLLAAAGICLVSGAAQAQGQAARETAAYPSKPIRFITPYAPGGGTSITAHMVGQKLAESLGQPVIVDNRPGGNTIIGADALVRSPPDGYTIMITGVNHVLVPLLQPTPYDVNKDFAAVATLTSGELVLVVHPSVPANTLQELVAFAKSRPGQLNYPSASTGGPTHLANELLNMMTGIKTQHIPYKGSGQAVTDLIGGQVQLYFSPLPAAISHIKGGRLKAIAITGEKRSSALPQVPTFAEAGLPGFDVKTWYGVFAPAGTPKAIVDKLSAEFARILAMPDIREKMATQGLDPFISTADQFAALVKADLAKFAKVIKAANIKLDQ